MTGQKQVNSYELIKETFLKDESIQRFSGVIGSDREAMAYIGSVLIAIANSDRLQACSRQSLWTSAMRAATLRLSCDPGTGQAWLVPYGKENPVCTLQIGWKGWKDIALRSGLYRYLNVYHVRAGEDPVEDPLTGLYKLGSPKIGADAVGGEYIGWLLSFELMTGYRTQFYMSIPEIHAHAKKFSKSYSDPDSPWGKHTEAMERKTVLSKGLRERGLIDLKDRTLIAAIAAEDEQAEEDTHQEWIESEEAETSASHPAKSVQENVGILYAEGAKKSAQQPEFSNTGDVQIFRGGKGRAASRSE